MPQVAAWTRARDRSLEDPAREALVLREALAAAAARGLVAERVRPFFALQIELAKSVQARASGAESELDLARQIRPALLRLGDRIVAALARGGTLEGASSAPLEAWLEPAEIEQLAASVRRVGNP